eukprot:TRINITY_DN24084_c0_g1_i1.p1 TRINITY_DN24084_c0_g1~~TRINITY_DN24084_c0_g1_i1.p1  ORF type:complete len:652 (+),score=56.36 TRINITY_DN24084_c0_g1_i1:51-2006(+)
MRLPLLLVFGVAQLVTAQDVKLLGEQAINPHSDKVVVYKDHAYLFNQYIHIYDVSDRANPILVGIDDDQDPQGYKIWTGLVDSDNKRMYVYYRLSMHIFDLDNPASPKRIQKLDFPSECEWHGKHGAAHGTMLQTDTRVYFHCTWFDSTSAKEHDLRLVALQKDPVTVTIATDVVVHNDELSYSMTLHDDIIYLIVKHYDTRDLSMQRVRIEPQGTMTLLLTDWDLPRKVEFHSLTYYNGFLYATCTRIGEDKLWKFDPNTGAILPLQISLPNNLNRWNRCRHLRFYASKAYLACEKGLMVLEETMPDTFTLHYGDLASTKNSFHQDFEFSGANLFALDSSKLVVYSVPTPPPTPAPTSAPTHLGCFKTYRARFLPKHVYRGSSNTPTSCAERCSDKGYSYAGVEYGRECWCGNSIARSIKTATKECNKKCTGDPNEWCGGGHRMDLYSLQSYTPPPPPSRVGCFKVQTKSRVLTTLAFQSQGNTVEECTSVCRWNNFKYAGLENGNECWCGNSMAGAVRTTVTDCDRPCPGDGTQWCGDGYRNLAYVVDGSAAVVPSATYEGCFANSVNSRLFPVLAYISPSGNTMEECTAACFHNGYSYAGMEYRRECWCGNSVSSSLKVPEDKCKLQCSGNSQQTCGGHAKLSVYRKN